MTRHIHADHIITAANDTSIEWQVRLRGMDWMPKSTPSWTAELEYRQKPAPHPHQALIDQAAADPSIEWQILSTDGVTWMNVVPGWAVGCQYRQKPKRVDMWQWAVACLSVPTYIVRPSSAYFTNADEAKSYYGGEHEILCRIEGSKISVEVSK
jgi:hypothetical protein